MRAPEPAEGTSFTLGRARHRERSREPGHRRGHLRQDGAAMAVGGRHKALAAALVDLPAGSDFEAKAGRLLGLYAREWEGGPLTDDDYVVTSDERTSFQARARRHPTLAPAPGRDMRAEFEYERGGALQYLAAWGAHRAKTFGRCDEESDIVPFGRLVSQMMTEPYASARRVFWVVEGGSSHRGQAACERLSSAWPNATLVQLPVHASWLNQVEILFSIVQRKVLTPNDFEDLAEVAGRLATSRRRSPSSGSSPGATRLCS